jgi:inhibitor of nuclear factor kappa-B kinase subunit alpha
MKGGVWYSVSARRDVGPVFFNEIIVERYVQAILGQLFPELTEEERLYGRFQQDSVTAHTARISMQALSDVFRDRIISSGIWPACSPDLNPCDFFFWGCLKDKVYNSNHQTVGELKENICREMANIPAEQLQRVNQNLFCWCEECLRVEGQHFQHLLCSVNCNYFIPNVIGQRAY